MDRKLLNKHIKILYAKLQGTRRICNKNSYPFIYEVCDALIYDLEEHLDMEDGNPTDQIILIEELNNLDQYKEPYYINFYMNFFYYLRALYENPRINASKRCERLKNLESHFQNIKSFLNGDDSDFYTSSLQMWLRNAILHSSLNYYPDYSVTETYLTDSAEELDAISKLSEDTIEKISMGYFTRQQSS